MEKRLTIMKPKLFLAAAGLSLLLAYPVSQALTQRDKIIQSQQRAIHSLQLQVKQPQKPAQKPATLQSVVVPPAVVAPAPAIKLASFSCENYASLFDQYNWDASTAMAICQAESGGNPSAISPASINADGISDFGLMQLHGVDILDPAQNVAYAYNHKYLTQGWGAWSTFNSGKYRQYL